MTMSWLMEEFFDQQVNNKEVTYDNIWKVTNCRGDNCTTGWLQYYHYFKEHYKIILFDLSKQETLT